MLNMVTSHLWKLSIKMEPSSSQNIMSVAFKTNHTMPFSATKAITVLRLHNKIYEFLRFFIVFTIVKCCVYTTKELQL